MIKRSHNTPDLSDATWLRSSYSGGHNECVELATNIRGKAPVRDSKRVDGPVLGFSRQAWRSFVNHIS